MFSNISNFTYIKAENKSICDALSNDYAPLFRKKFSISKNYQHANLVLQALGYAEVYINGKPITDNLFLSPTSDYNKLRWYNVFDVTEILNPGENVIAVICGNGFFNEKIKTEWYYDIADWRDIPKISLKLFIDNIEVLESDETWLCNVKDSFIIYNQLRSGVHFDARKYDNNWNRMEYDDSNWQQAIADCKPFNGKYQLCSCPPVRETETYKPIKILKNSVGYVADFGKNLSGYISLSIQQNKGDMITIKYVEEIDEQGNIRYLDDYNHYFPTSDFQTDKLICSGGKDFFKPKFTYHGFRYAQIEGLSSPLNEKDITAYFVHQDIKITSTFKSSHDVLNFIYSAGIRATQCNMFYMMTDCPSREKMGWCNDAQATMEQALYDFDCLSFYKKWFEDIKSSMREDGALPAVIPSSGWGFNFGPVCDYLLYELPYQIYMFYGDSTMLKEGLPFFKRYLDYLNAQIECKFHFILADWTGEGDSPLIPTAFIIEIYRIKILRTICFTEKLILGEADKSHKIALEKYEREFKEEYINDDRSVLDEQTAIAMILTLRLCTSDKIKRQLIDKIERDNFQLQCGMVGVQYLYYALTECGKADYAFKIITESEPGYKTWFKNGATTLWEKWDGVNRCSHNHQMFSCVIAWFYKELLGVAPMEDYPAFKRILLNPHFVDDLQLCQGSFQTIYGKISAKWERTKDGIIYQVEIPENVDAIFQEKRLKTGSNTFIIQ